MWYHGSQSAQPQPDMQAIWFADDLREARFYAGAQGTLHAARLPQLPELDQPMLELLCADLGVPWREQEELRVRGLLYKGAQEQICQAARRRGSAGLIMLDRTAGNHLTAAIWEPSIIRWQAVSRASRAPCKLSSHPLWGARACS